MVAPDTGDIIWLDFTPQTGHEQAGKRPALVLSPQAYNAKTHLAVLCPITTQIKGYPFEVRIQGAKIDGVILADQIKSLDWVARGATIGEKAPGEALTRTIQLLGTLLQI